MNWRRFLLRLKKRDRFQIDVRYFPEATRACLPGNVILKYGALPLGTKEDRILNIGLLDPLRVDARDALEGVARLSGKRAQFYEISAKDFVAVLEAHYGIDTAAVRSMSDLDPTLRLFLDAGN